MYLPHTDLVVFEKKKRRNMDNHKWIVVSILNSTYSQNNDQRSTMADLLYVLSNYTLALMHHQL